MRFVIIIPLNIKNYGLLKCDTRAVRYMDTMFLRNVLLTSYGFTLKINKTDSPKRRYPLPNSTTSHPVKLYF